MSKERVELDLSEDGALNETAKVRIYWAPAAEYQLGNFQQEIKEGGNIVRPEAPLVFSNHVRATSQPDEIRFIEASKAFKNKVIRSCETMAEAEMLTRQQMAMKSVKTIESSDISREDMSIKA